LKGRFPGKVESINGTPTPESSGKFEVTVNGTLVHSKANGDGHVTPDNIKDVFDKIDKLG